MRTIQTSFDINGSHQALVQFPEDIPLGQHHGVILLDPEEEKEKKKKDWIDGFPVFSLGGWPEDFTMSRDQLYDDDGR